MNGQSSMPESKNTSDDPSGRAFKLKPNLILPNISTKDRIVSDRIVLF